MTNFYNSFDVDPTDAFCDQLAQRYVDLRSKVDFDYSELDGMNPYAGLTFSSDKIKAIIEKHSVSKKRHPIKHLDVCRSDLGELLMLQVFDQDAGMDGSGQHSRFCIPVKNISIRERPDLPGRGLDILGYRYSGNVELLLGEAKLSEEKNNPPAVVHTSKDSLYKAHKMHIADKSELMAKIASVAKRCSLEDATPLLAALVSLDHDLDKHSLVLGCCLVRDSHCVKIDEDYGKLMTHHLEFLPHRIEFVIPVLLEKVEEVADRFISKVTALVDGEAGQ